MAARIIVTGIAGFIGSNLADYLLKNGHEIIGVDDLSYGLLEQVPSKVNFHQIDIFVVRLQSTSYHRRGLIN